jgi:hypothetical protein
MENSTLVSIDLGSAYTKVGIRRGWNGPASLVQDASIGLEDENYCIPSVVARQESATKTEWFIGLDAAAVLPGDGAKVFRNWKADLFNVSRDSFRDNKRAAAVARDEAFIVAVEFFRTLRRVLAPHLAKRDAADAPVRVSVPKFDGDEASYDLIERVLLQAGWQPAAYRSTIFEPESNALGLLSRGRNATWFPKQPNYRARPQRSISMPRMLEPTLARSFQEMRDHHGVLVTDIGAFTTDFGYVNFDSSFKRKEEWSRPIIVQKSYALGIRELDDAVMAILSEDAREYFRNESADRWDRAKRELYAGKPQKLSRRGSRAILVGDGDEADAIQREINAFADRVVAARAEFCLRADAAQIHEEIVTGGGSNIRTLRQHILKRIAVPRRTVHDLLDPEEPKRATERGAGRMNASQEDERKTQNLLLIRGGSAIGGASVFFEKE